MCGRVFVVYLYLFLLIYLFILIYFNEFISFLFLQLHHFYACYRAVVRGKIQAMTSQDMMQSKEDREKAAVLASQYFNLACRYSSIFDVRDVGFSAPFLIIMCGFTGSGKSFIAKRLARMLSLQYISSDEVRKTLFASNATALQSSLSRPETDHSSSGSSSNDKEENKLDSGMYSLNNRELVYNEMNKIAWSHLHAIQNDSFSPSRPFGLKELKIDMQKPSSETASSSTSASYSSASSSNVPLPCSVHNGCILDATFLSRKNRAPAYEIAMSTGAIPILLHVCVTDDTAKARIEHRAQKDKTNPSEGTWNVFVNQKKNFEEFDQLVLSSSRAFNENKLVINIDASIDRPWERAYDEIVMKRDIDMQTLRFG